MQLGTASVPACNHSPPASFSKSLTGSDGKISACNAGETQFLSLPWEDPLEKGMRTHSHILAWKIPWTGELGGLYSLGSQRITHDFETNTLPNTFLLAIDLISYFAKIGTFLFRNHFPFPTSSTKSCTPNLNTPTRV